MDVDPRLVPLLEHPAIWRGRSAARIGGVSTGFAALDAHLPGGGWPQVGLVELLVPRLGVGELYLLLPALARLTAQLPPRWCAFIGAPLPLNAPALAAHGVTLPQVLVARTAAPLWGCEQALRSGACAVVLSWIERVQPRALRRLQLAAERGRTLGVLFRALSLRTEREPSSAVLRLAVEPTAAGMRIHVIKSRGGLRGALDLPLDPGGEHS